MLPGPDSRRLERLGEYAIHRVVGEGGMGIVYEATERLSGRRVALKVLHSSLANNEGARDRFFSEMRIMAGLEHPNIVRSLSSAEIDGKLVMVLEYLDGRTLREELELRGRLPLSLTITVASAIAAALGAAHGASPCVVHRDLKPENVMLATDGRIKVMDFGIAKVLGDGNTHTTQAVGTVRYMSPEQAGGGVISPQTDLYALGLLIFEMLSGKAPFESPSLLAVLRHHCETPAPPLPDDVRREIPIALEELLLQLLEKDPRARVPAVDAPAAPATPAAAPSPGCRAEDLCVPFTSATPGAVAAETIIGESDQLARRLDPRAVLVSAGFHNAVADGSIDTTRTFSMITLFYALPDGSIMVQLKPTGFIAMKTPGLANSDPFAPATCPLKRAWEVAFGARVASDSKSWAMLTLNLRRQGPAWTLSMGRESHLVDARTCALIS